MSIPKYDEMYRDVLDVLSGVRSLKVNELRNIMAEKTGISADDKKAILPSGGLVFNNRLNWTCAYLKQAGLVETVSRGVYKITADGEKVLEENPVRIDNKYLNRFDSFKNFISRGKTDKTEKNENKISETEISENGLSPQDIIDEAFGRITLNLTDDILSEIMKQTPEFFEHLVVKLLTGMGYGSSLDDSAIVTKYSCDEGIDGIIREDKLGFDNIYIQAKRWDRNTTIGRPEIQKFVGALAGQGAGKGLFITTAKFSKEAREYAAKQHTTKTVLVDGETLAKLMIENNVGVSTEKTYFVKKIDSDFFDDSFN